MGGPRIIASGKMTASQYATLHQWVRKCLGKAYHCDECGTTEPRVYQWANISNEYKRDLSDWRPMCVPCHAVFDNKSYDTRAYCKKGHLLTASNIYTKPNGKGRICRTCKNDANREFLREWRRKKRGLPEGYVPPPRPDKPPIYKLPHIKSLRELTQEQRVELGLITESGNLDVYRLAIVLGTIGARSEKTWDRVNKMHTCCQSKKSYRHKVRCPTRLP